MEYKVALTLVAIAIGLVSYVPYFRDMASGKTKPHAFSWFIWGLLTAIAFIVQLKQGGGAGAWVSGVTAFFCFVIAAFALFKGERNITKFDWFCLTAALTGIVLWQLTSEPLAAVLIVTLVDVLGLLPTFRKAYRKPFEETLSTFVLSTVKYALAVLALESYAVEVVLYPASVVVINGVFSLMVFVRRRQLKR